MIDRMIDMIFDPVRMGLASVATFIFGDCVGNSTISIFGLLNGVVINKTWIDVILSRGASTISIIAGVLAIVIAIRNPIVKKDIVNIIKKIKQFCKYIKSTRLWLKLKSIYQRFFTGKGNL
jgi:hypothetical protein